MSPPVNPVKDPSRPIVDPVQKIQFYSTMNVLINAHLDFIKKIINATTVWQLVWNVMALGILRAPNVKKATFYYKENAFLDVSQIHMCLI